MILNQVQDLSWDELNSLYTFLQSEEYRFRSKNLHVEFLFDGEGVPIVLGISRRNGKRVVLNLTNNDHNTELTRFTRLLGEKLAAEWAA